MQNYGVNDILFDVIDILFFELTVFLMIFGRSAMELIDTITSYVITCVIGSLLAIWCLLSLERCKHEFTPIDELTKQRGPKNSKVYVSRCSKCCKIKTKEVK